MLRILILLVLAVNVSIASSNEFISNFQRDCAKYLDQNECFNFALNLADECDNDQACFDDGLTYFEPDYRISAETIEKVTHMCDEANMTAIECFMVIKYGAENCERKHPEQDVNECLMEWIWEAIDENKAEKRAIASAEIEAIQRRCKAKGLNEVECAEVTETIKQVCEADSKCVNDLLDEARFNAKRSSHVFSRLPGFPRPFPTLQTGFLNKNREEKKIETYC